MDSPTTLKAQGRTAWKRTYKDNQRLLLLHTAIAVGLPLIVSLIGYYLEAEGQKASGLSGVELRGTLQAVQTLADLFVTLLLPFWQFGFVFAAVQIYRSSQATPSSLCEGFRLWSSLLGINLFRALRYTVEILCGIFFATLIYSLTPLSNGILNLLEEISGDPALKDATSEALMEVFLARLSVWDVLPYYLLCALCVVVLLIPTVYRYRLAEYFLMDAQPPKAMQALRRSLDAMRGNAKKYFLLDLRFWWYYLLQAAATASLFVPQIPAMPAIFLSSFLQFAVFVLFRGHVEMTYVAAYESMKEGDEILC